jgi:hypothetical protein
MRRWRRGLSSVEAVVCLVVWRRVMMGKSRAGGVEARLRIVLVMVRRRWRRSL